LLSFQLLVPKVGGQSKISYIWPFMEPLSRKLYGRLSNKIYVWPLMEFLNTPKVGGRTTKFAPNLSWCSRARCLRDPWKAECKKMRLASNFRRWKFEVKRIHFALGHSLRTFKHAECKLFCLGPLGILEHGAWKLQKRLKQIFLPWSNS